MDSPDYYKSVNKSISQLNNLRTKDYLHNFQFLKFNRPFINFPDLCHPASPCRSGWGDPRERRGVGSPLPPPPSPPQGVCSLSHIGILKSSVVDPFHFDTDPDPDPRIRFRWLRIRKFVTFFFWKKSFVDYLCLSENALNTQILEHLEEISWRARKLLLFIFHGLT